MTDGCSKLEDPSSIGPRPTPSPARGEGKAPATTIGLVSGTAVDLLAPDWREIMPSDVAYGLSQIRRWNGQARRPISVAEHSILVAKLVPGKHRLAALLHDAHEAIFGDIATPVANALVFRGGPRVKRAIDEIKRALDAAIARAMIEAFAPAGAVEVEGAEREAWWLAADMRADAVKAADAQALRYEGAVRRRGSLQKLDAFGECAARHLAPYAPDEGEMAARWLGDVKALTAARFAGGAA